MCFTPAPLSCEVVHPEAVEAIFEFGMWLRSLFQVFTLSRSLVHYFAVRKESMAQRTSLVRTGRSSAIGEQQHLNADMDADQLDRISETSVRPYSKPELNSASALGSLEDLGSDVVCLILQKLV